MLLMVALIYSIKKHILEVEYTDFAKMRILDISSPSLIIKSWYPDSPEFYIKVQMRYETFSKES